MPTSSSPRSPLCCRVSSSSPSSTSGAPGVAATRPSGRWGCCSSLSRSFARPSPRPGGWSEPIYRVWYLTGAVWTAGWLGLGNAFLLGRTRFGFGFALCLFFAGLFTFLTARRNPEIYADATTTAMLYFLVAGVLALAVSVETYFQNWRWPWMALLAVGGATVLSLVLMVMADLPAPGLRAGSRDWCPDRRDLAAGVAAADAVHEHHGCLRADPGCAVLGLCLHAQASRAGLLTGPGPVGRPVPVQPLHRTRRHHRQLRGLAARRAQGALHGQDPQSRAGDAAHRPGCVHPGADRQLQSLRLDRVVPAGQAPGCAAAACRVPGLDRDVQRDPRSPSPPSCCVAPVPNRERRPDPEAIAGALAQPARG